MAEKYNSFWISNISNRNVTLSDLNITIKAFSSINLLDIKHYKYNISQLIASSTTGSIYKKRSKILLRVQGPKKEEKVMLFNKDTHIPSRERSVFVIKEEVYEELNIGSDNEKFAEDDIEMNINSKPIFVKVTNAI